MVGFPGETAQDHSASVRLIESLPFTYLHIFPYSARPGTPAAAMPVQVNGRIARQRAEEIRPFTWTDRKSTRLNSSHVRISYAVFCLNKKIYLTTSYVRLSQHTYST